MLPLQDPAEADKLFKIQRELDETKIILVSINNQKVLKNYHRKYCVIHLIACLMLYLLASLLKMIVSSMHVDNEQLIIEDSVVEDMDTI